MKKTKLFWLLGFIILNFINVSANNGTTIPIQSTILDDDEGGTGGGVITVNSNCEIDLRIPFYVTNLEQFDNTVVVIDNDIHWILPASKPLMDVHYTIGDYSGIVPLDYFSHFGTVTTDEGVLIEVYVGYAEITVDVSEQCELSYIDDMSSIDYEIALMTRPITTPEGTSLPLPYPICDFLDIADIFACEVYDFCHEEDPVKGKSSSARDETLPDECVEGNVHINSGSLAIECNEECYIEPDESTGKERSTRDTDLIQNLSPNPFNSSIHLEINTEASGDVNYIELLDATGTSILLKPNVFLNGQKHLELDLSHLSPGLYFLRLDCKNESKTVKLFKQ